MKSIFWVTSSLPTFSFMLYLAQPLLQGSETMTMVSYVLIAAALALYLIGCVAAYRRKEYSSLIEILIEIFGTKRDFLYDAFVSVIGLMIHYSTGYDDAITWCMLLVVSVLSLTQTRHSVSAKQSAE